MASPLSNPHLSSVTDTHSLRGGGKRHNGSDSWRRRRHRRSGIVDFGIDRLEGAAPTKLVAKQERVRRTREVVRGCARD
eukprot:scaffold107964_cov59-Phaeocystis_antarctica.AAC.3